MLLLSFLCLGIIAPIAVVTAFFGLEVLAGLRPLRRLNAEECLSQTVIVIPAHDEESVIGPTVQELIQTGSDACRVLVVADNCEDATAACAEMAGAQVLVRGDAARRGKGFALAAAQDYLRADPPQVVIVLDADCRFDGSSLRELSVAAVRSQRACQAINLLVPDLTAPALVQISNFAFMIKNLVRQRGLQRLGGRAHLTGTGMALPWALFEGADLGGSNIVEDLALGLNLAERGRPPRLVEGATVWSSPASKEGTLIQRRRWEGGYLATSLRRAPGALLRALARTDLRGLAAALDLSIPPLALLFVLNALSFALGLFSAAVGESIWLLILEISAVALAGLALMLAWMCEGRPFVSAGTLLRLPLYVLWKLPIYLGFVRVGAPKEWLRSGR